MTSLNLSFFILVITTLYVTRGSSGAGLPYSWSPFFESLLGVPINVVGWAEGGAAHHSSEQWRPPVRGPSLPPACPHGHGACAERRELRIKQHFLLFLSLLLVNRREVRQTQQKPTLATGRKLKVYTATHTPYASQVAYDPCY